MGLKLNKIQTPAYVAIQAIRWTFFRDGKQIQSIEEITEKLGLGEIVWRQNIECNIELNP